MSNKIKGYTELIILIILMTLLSFGSYQWQKWKLENIWDIKNPTFWQVMDSMNNKAIKKGK